MDMWYPAAHREGVMANLDAAEEIQGRTRDLLTRVSHAPFTFTPSPPGAPPAAISGVLAASVQAEHDGEDAIVGPTRAASSYNGPYGRFLELGGEHSAHNSTGYMHWLEDGAWWRMTEIAKEGRPFLKPATDDAVHSGAVHQIYWDHWLIAQQSVT
jgi:hypothetical protein